MRKLVKKFMGMMTVAALLLVAVPATSNVDEVMVCDSIIYIDLND